MPDQTKNAQSSPSQQMPKNAGGIDDIDERENHVEGEERIGEDDARQAGEDRQSESEKTISPDSRGGSERKS